MMKFITALLVLVCLVGYGFSIKCHVCINDEDCLYGTTAHFDLKECKSDEDRCYRGVFRRGDRWAISDIERGCAKQNFCTEERKKENLNYDVNRCELCDYDGWTALKCHTCTNTGDCFYGTTQWFDMKECKSEEDRCFHGIFKKGDHWSYNDYVRGCATQDFCREERSKQNSTYVVSRCELCDYEGCNSGSLSF
ncbi:hypothetical protein WA026_020928 [Henosepilachna vigintioctopunctata]|uniref:Uncharacterized protein n=1 Tax=Henosepilachna vigintioctopunctata TaxID=420089 RepID=A0AAW1URF7_9CUCU